MLATSDSYYFVNLMNYLLSVIQTFVNIFFTILQIVN